ncbi:MAG: hypothetical protein ABIG85_06035 [Chloroflexota bacterium]
MSKAGAAVPSAARRAADGPVPANGILEELDGSPIGLRSSSPVSAGASIPWWRGWGAATALTVRRSGLWVFALAAFLARGGIAVLVLPVVVVPTFVGLANYVGPASVSAEGPGPQLVALVAAGVAIGLGLAVVGTLVAAAAEVALHRATLAAALEAGPASVALPAVAFGPAGEAGAGRAVARVAVLRLLLLVPLAAVAAVAVPAWIAVAYRELTLPSDVAAPLAARVLVGAPVASAAVFGTWLAMEVVGGFAARRAVLLGAPIPRALAGGLLDLLRAPVGTICTTGVALAGTVLVLAPGWWAIGAAWDAARHAFAGGSEVLAALVAALLLAAAWLAVLVLAALAAAWRATLFTMEFVRRPR